MQPNGWQQHVVQIKIVLEKRTMFIIYIDFNLSPSYAYQWQHETKVVLQIARRN